MSPQSPRYPKPASGDDAAPPGRHRRPESLAELGGPRSMIAVPAPRPAPRAFTPARSASSHAITSRPASSHVIASRAASSPATTSHPAPSPVRASRAASSPVRAARAASPVAARAASPSSDSSGTQRRRPAPGPRHSVAARDASRRPPIGAHRAPGTLAIESWLLIGSKRQQMLLASLIAAALLLIAIPIRRDGINAVDAAAGAAGSHAAGKHPRKNGGNPDHDNGPATGPQPSSAAPKPSTSASAKAPATEARQPAGQGPAHSLRTTGSQAISLTFDDGPDPVQTPKILALLDKYQVKATFCLVGQNVQRHPEIVRQIVAAGHTLCNHTWNHSLTIGRDQPAQIQADLARTSAAIQAAAPGTPIPFFRAPGGNFTDRLVAVAKAAGMTSLYWAVDPRDWDHPAGESDSAHVARVIAALHESVRPGAIILSHDFNQPDTIEAYGKLLPWLTGNFETTIPGQTPPATPGTPAPSSPTATPATATPDAITSPAADGAATADH